MARIAHIDIETGKVINVAEGEEINPISGLLCIFSDIANIGDSFDGESFVKPEMPAPSIFQQIRNLEAQQTPRRIREAALTDAGRAWLESLDEQITSLRNHL